MKHKIKQQIALVSLCFLAGMLVSFATQLQMPSELGSQKSHFREWKYVQTPKDLLSKDQWYDLSRSSSLHD